MLRHAHPLATKEGRPAEMSFCPLSGLTPTYRPFVKYAGLKVTAPTTSALYFREADFPFLIQLGECIGDDASTDEYGRVRGTAYIKN